MKYKSLIIVGVIAFLLGGVAGILVGGNNQPYGATGTRFLNGISADSTSPSAGQVRGTTLTITGASTLTGDGAVSGGTLNVTTANTATSTIIGGCFQFYATSTATAHKFQASTTPGIMISTYGTCPNL